MKSLDYLEEKLNMGEIIDTKPIESVQAALSLFGDQRKNSPRNKNELEIEKDLETVLKDFASLKFELEVKDSAHKQALFRLSQNKSAVDELLAQLMSSGLEKDVYINECRAYKARVEELELKTKEMSDQALESARIREQLSCVMTELRAAQGEILSLETEVVAVRDAKVEALRRVEMVESALSAERFKSEQLSRNVSNLNETILRLKKSVSEAEENAAALSEREAELELVAENAREEAEVLKSQLESMENLEKRVLEKNEVIASLEVQLVKANQLLSTSEEMASDSAIELKKLESELEFQERKNWDHSGYISLLETEIKQLKQEVGKANENIARLEAAAEDKDSEAQAEIASLKAELHRQKSQIAAAEAAEARATSEKLALNLAIEQLALESEQAKQEARRLREAEKVQEERTQDEKSDQLQEGERELELLKRELQSAMHKVAEFRKRAEQAISRAEAAEKAKATLENRIMRWKELKEKRKQAIAALREDSISREKMKNFKYDSPVNSPRAVQPLGKVLKMKF